jgi:hypothetical protein
MELAWVNFHPILYSPDHARFCIDIPQIFYQNLKSFFLYFCICKHYIFSNWLIKSTGFKTRRYDKISFYTL